MKLINPQLLIIFYLTFVFEKLPAQEASPRPNIIFILTDDHRYDALGFMGHPFLKTPHLDRMAREGVHFTNAYVTTSLCSPSRASILTGLYAHHHQVVDNYNPISDDLTIFPQYLQQAGYQTAFIGKWHMGNTDEPRPGFDHWLSFKGQGTYWPDGHGTSRVVPQNNFDGFNINGKKVPQKGYITDELTDYAIEWLSVLKDDKPFMLYISHKAVHSDFVAADRHLGKYQDTQMPLPVTYANTIQNYDNKPMWLKNQRNSRHGVDFAYNLPDFDLNKYYQRYTETLLAVDDNVGKLLSFLEEQALLDKTIIIYMGDNGFQFGEHGLIDKRTAYTASVKVPLLIRYPAWFKKGEVVNEMVANIDIAPTLLDIAGVDEDLNMDGMSFLPVLQGKPDPWRENLLYEYYWENNYPYTPTTFALITDRYKFIHYYGIWDLDELYDLQNDPSETNNLISNPEFNTIAVDLKKQLMSKIEATGGNQIPLLEERGTQFPWRKKTGSKQAPFPDTFFK